jgi:release factor glutamine methyltransferase
MANTVAGILADAIKLLKSAGIEDAEISARKILEHLLEKSPSGLQLIYSNEVDCDIVSNYIKLIQKRATRFPLQYIIGEVEFYNVTLKVDERALIPRPETELIVERAIELLSHKTAPKILDLGTGSGDIAIAIARNIANSKITAVDISQDSINLAQENARINEVENSISFICDDCFRQKFFTDIGQFDLMVSNPPYIAADDYNSLQPEVRLYEPKIALVPDRETLSFYEIMACHLSKAINKGGSIIVEMGINQSAAIKLIFKKYNPHIEIKIISDLTGIERIIIGTFQ